MDHNGSVQPKIIEEPYAENGVEHQLYNQIDVILLFVDKRLLHYEPSSDMKCLPCPPITCRI